MLRNLADVKGTGFTEECSFVLEFSAVGKGERAEESSWCFRPRPAVDLEKAV